jgi:hypothetical protein
MSESLDHRFFDEWNGRKRDRDQMEMDPSQSKCQGYHSRSTGVSRPDLDHGPKHLGQTPTQSSESDQTYSETLPILKSYKSHNKETPSKELKSVSPVSSHAPPGPRD